MMCSEKPRVIDSKAKELVEVKSGSRTGTHLVVDVHQHRSCEFVHSAVFPKIGLQRHLNCDDVRDEMEANTMCRGNNSNLREVE